MGLDERRVTHLPFSFLELPELHGMVGLRFGKDRILAVDAPKYRLFLHERQPTWDALSDVGPVPDASSN